MIPRPRPERFRLRRTMMFMNAQRPGLIKDAYIYGVDSIILDLEDAVAENQKDAARFSLYHALRSIDYGKTEVLVRMNGIETPHWQEDIRVCVAGGADGVRIAKCESADDVKCIEEHVRVAEKEFGVEEGRTLLMAALESPKGILNAREICQASDRMLGVAISGGDFRKSMHVRPVRSGIEINTARSLMLLAAREAGIQWLRRWTMRRDFARRWNSTMQWALTARASSIRGRLPMYTRPLLRPRRRSRRQNFTCAALRNSRNRASASIRSMERWSTFPLSRMRAA